jgi:transposase-like protein
MVKKCVFCKSSSVVKNGLRKRKVRIKQSFLCLKCKRQFVEPDGFERMRYKPKDIVRAVHMCNDGMSLWDVKNHLWQHDGIKVSRSTISDWCKKYGVFLKSDKKTGETNPNWAAALRRKIHKSQRKR